MNKRTNCAILKLGTKHLNNRISEALAWALALISRKANKEPQPDVT
jgi:hypothetical protein